MILTNIAHHMTMIHSCKWSSRTPRTMTVMCWTKHSMRMTRNQQFSHRKQRKAFWVGHAHRPHSRMRWMNSARYAAVEHISHRARMVWSRTSQKSWIRKSSRTIPLIRYMRPIAVRPHKIRATKRSDRIQSDCHLTTSIRDPIRRRPRNRWIRPGMLPQRRWANPKIYRTSLRHPWVFVQSCQW